MEKPIILYGDDRYITFDFEVTASHTRYARFYLTETIIDDWEITLISVDGWPASCFTEEAQAKIVKALEETDLLQEQYEAIQADHIADYWDRKRDEEKERRIA